MIEDQRYDKGGYIARANVIGTVREGERIVPLRYFDSPTETPASAE